MAFHNVRIPTEVEIGARGGIGGLTLINELASGAEQRNIEWSLGRGRWDISYGAREKVDIDAVKAHHLARYFRAHSFPFKDWTDYIMPRQGIGTGDGVTTSFPIYKLYGGEGGYYYQRYLALIVSSAAWVNGVPLEFSGGYTVTLSTLDGFVCAYLVLPAAAPGGHVVEFACHFDCLVRYDIERLEIQAIKVEEKDEDDFSAQTEGLEQLGPTPIIEVREL